MIPARNIGSLAIPENSIIVETIDLHTAGEPLRVILSGFPELPAHSVLACRQQLAERFDFLRTALMWEPRGHADMYGAVITPSQVADLGAVFLHNAGYSTMCGHATIALGKLAVEAGWVAPVEPLTTFHLEAPCGRIKVLVEVQQGRAGTVRFQNVPSFVLARDQSVRLDTGQTLSYDVAYGGAFYAILDVSQVGLTCSPDQAAELIRWGRLLKQAIQEQGTAIEHPIEPELGFLYGVIFVGPPEAAAAHSRNVCIFADGELDRSPTGSGVSARLALAHARGEIEIDQSIQVESILGTTFGGRIVKTTEFGGRPAVIPEVSGTARITGQHRFILDPDDPLRDGFLLR